MSSHTSNLDNGTNRDPLKPDEEEDEATAAAMAAASNLYASPAVAPPSHAETAFDSDALAGMAAGNNGTAQYNKWAKNAYGNPIRQQAQGAKYTAEETEIVRKAVKEFCNAKQISVARLCSECEHKAELKGAWMEIAKALPNRSVQSVYRHGIRQLHPFKRGAWTQEETAMLLDLVHRVGKKWATIQRKLHRSADSCRDKYREMSEEFVKGRWTEPETDALKRLIRDFVGVDSDMPMLDVAKYVEEQGIQIPWSLISKRIVKRSRLSCFKKWQKMAGLMPELGSEVAKAGESGGDGSGLVDDSSHHHHRAPHDDDHDPTLPHPGGIGEAYLTETRKRARLPDGTAMPTAFAEAPTAGAAAAAAAAAAVAAAVRDDGTNHPHHAAGTAATASAGATSYEEFYDDSAKIVDLVLPSTDGV